MLDRVENFATWHTRETIRRWLRTSHIFDFDVGKCVHLPVLSLLCGSIPPTMASRSSKRSNADQAAKKLADEVLPKLCKTNHKTETMEGSREHLPHLAMN